VRGGMPVTLTEKLDSRKWTTGDNASVEFVYILTGTSDDVTAKVLIENSTATSYDGLVRQSIQIEPEWVDETTGGPFRSGTRAGRQPRATAPGADPTRKCRRNGGGMPPSPLAWYGAKGRLAPTIVKLFPPHQTYVEPFLGGGSVFFAKPPSPVEVVNDVHGDLVNFFRVLRDGAQRDRLLDLVEGSPWSRKEFCNALAARKAGRWKDDAERARLFLVATRQARNGVGRRPSDWSYATGKTTAGASSRTSMWMRLPERLAVAGLRLQAAQIECGPWQAVLDRYESENTLAYCDPPYLHSTRRRQNRNSYDHEMTEADHARLLLRLKQFKGKVVLSGYASSLYDELLSGWRRIEIETTSSASNRANKKHARRTEVLWLNYASPVADAA
jgi:DNA adenine methylase